MEGARRWCRLGGPIQAVRHKTVLALSPTIPCRYKLQVSGCWAGWCVSVYDICALRHPTPHPPQLRSKETNATPMQESDGFVGFKAFEAAIRDRTITGAQSGEDAMLLFVVTMTPLPPILPRESGVYRRRAQLLVH